MHKQRGLSMVEVLISLLISSFLILGITQVYLDNKENSLFQQSQGGNLENARFSILILEQTLSRTGYRRMPDQPPETVFPITSTSDCGTLNAGQVAKKVSDTSFCIRYQPAFTGAQDCAGNNIAGIPTSPYQDGPVVTEFYALVDLDTSDADNSLQLACNGNVIASNISAVRFEYGVNSNSEKVVSKYTSSPATSENIRAVQFSIMAASPTEITKNAGSTAYTYWFGTAPADKKLYTMLSTSTSMRNLMP
ncbi:PilW family protein [Pseudomonas sp. BMS12]|uniref:PilW family protein n=1 Tax=Pseudomonas sp. BMS12 TaxID=1796033 RepID=UPI00083B57BC|nr:PilW family protein [Pseudomonas sp. BMS12]